MAAAVSKVVRGATSRGAATVLAIGTATPENCVYQADYADYYFRVTKSEHLVHLKDKFKRICNKSMIRKRHMHLTEKLLEQNPSLRMYMAPSLDARQDMMVAEIPRLGKSAAQKAIKEWGQPLSKITHLVFCSSRSGVDMPGADFRLIQLLGLQPSVRRVMLYQQGCLGGGTMLRVAKDLAENNRGARVLVVCSETTVGTFRGPSDADANLDWMVVQALFGDGAAALIIRADTDYFSQERPLFELISASQTILPGTDGFTECQLREAGLTLTLHRDVPSAISKNMDRALREAFTPLGIHDWNSIFWVAHNGGPAILDRLEAEVKLEKKRMRATRHILSEYGNMSSACVLFILDEMRRRSVQDGQATTGEGLEWGVLFGFDPGGLASPSRQSSSAASPLLPLHHHLTIKTNHVTQKMKEA